MKLYEAQNRSFISTSIVAKEWKDELCSFSNRIKFNSDVIQQLRDGLELGRLLNLPIELACNFQCLGYLFCGDGGILRPFNHMK